MPDTLAPRAVMGVLVPSSNSVVEPELAALRPPGVSNQTARFTLDANVLDSIADAAVMVAACGADAVLVALSAEVFPNGLALLQAGADAVAARTGRPVYTASHATVAAIHALGVRRVSVVTPFGPDAGRHVRDAYEAEGLTVAAVTGLGCEDVAAIARAPLADVRRLFVEADRSDAEALVHVGTGLPVVGLVDQLERDFAKPVVACNAALYWQALRASGVADVISGAGRLLASH
jgi:maleate isomerase